MKHFDILYQFLTHYYWVRCIIKRKWWWEMLFWKHNPFIIMNNFLQELSQGTKNESNDALQAP